jgi:hypothetical protein
MYAADSAQAKNKTHVPTLQYLDLCVLREQLLASWLLILI